MTPTDLPTVSLRLDLPNGSRFGPGKAALLRAIEKTGSISAAARDLGLSYPKASRLVAEMNAAHAAPIVQTRQGGAAKGGAELTEDGANLLSVYDHVCAASLSSLSDHAASLPDLSPL